MAELKKTDRAQPSPNQTMKWGSDLAAELLRKMGVKYITHNPGSSLRGLHDSIVNYLGNEDPTLLLCLNENQAVAIAHGYAKVTGEPMGCMLHANVGLLNGAMAIFNAWADRAPVYLIGGGGPADAARRLPWIHWIHSSRDQASYVRGFTKWDDEPRSPGAMVESMLRANILARTAPKGPTYICLDAGLQEVELSQPPELPDLSRFGAAEAPEPAASALARAADLLANANSPVILAGRVSRSREDWDRRVRLAELLGAKVATDLKTAAAFPSDHPLHLVPGYHLRGARREAVAAADVVLSLDWMDLGSVLRSVYESGPVTAKIIQCSVDSYIHKAVSMDHFSLPPVDVPLQVEPDVAVRHLLPAVEQRLAGRPRKWDGPGKPAGGGSAPAADPQAPIAIEDLARAIQAIREGNKITIARYPFSFPGLCRFDDPLDYLGLDGGAGVGSGPGNTVGTALALLGSGRMVLGIIGDSEFLQGATALWTAAHYEIPMLLVVANNRSHLNDELVQERIALQRGRAVENKWIGQRIDDPAVDIVRIARGMGVGAEGPVETLGQLPAALKRGLEQVAAGKPYVVEVVVLPEDASRLS